MDIDMPLKLLIADDEDVIRNGITKYIQLHTDRFEKIFTAGNGQEALDIIFTHHPDIMLLDVQMPFKNGIDVMREAGRGGITPVTIILSGYDEFKYAQQALRYGAKDYLLKPSRASDILQKLNELADEYLQDRDMQAAPGKESKHHIVGIAIEYINEHYHEDITLQSAADHVEISASYLSTLFTQNMEHGFVDYLNTVRVNHACAYLEQSILKTYEIAFKVGFRDEKYFSKVFKKIIGVSPSEYRKTRQSHE
mgnify:CR=1 FL=1